MRMAMTALGQEPTLNRILNGDVPATIMGLF